MAARLRAPPSDVARQLPARPGARRRRGLLPCAPARRRRRRAPRSSPSRRARCRAARARASRPEDRDCRTAWACAARQTPGPCARHASRRRAPRRRRRQSRAARRRGSESGGHGWPAARWPAPGWPEGQRYVCRPAFSRHTRRRHHARDVQRDRRAERRQECILAQHAFEQHRGVSGVRGARVEPLEQGRAIRGTRAASRRATGRRPHTRSRRRTLRPADPRRRESRDRPTARAPPRRPRQAAATPSGLIREQDAGGRSGNERDSGEGRGRSHTADACKGGDGGFGGARVCSTRSNGATEERRNTLVF